MRIGLRQYSLSEINCLFVIGEITCGVVFVEGAPAIDILQGDLSHFMVNISQEVGLYHGI